MEKHQSPLMTFVDPTKAFDSVNREAPREILSKAGCPEKFINTLKLLHNKMSARVLMVIDESDASQVKTGVKLGCVIAPTLFSVFIAALFIL